MKRITVLLAAMIFLLMLTVCADGQQEKYVDDVSSSVESDSRQPENEEENRLEGTESGTTQEDTEMEKETQEMEKLGALSPEDALKYMQETENLVMVDVAATRWYNEEHFEGALNIPIEELDRSEEDALFMEIPEGCPVLMHCRLGMIVPGAYERVLELRDDIPQIAYIDGAPLFQEYNEWKRSQDGRD